jgi:hypothetical protein
MGVAFDSAWHRLAFSGSALAAPWRAGQTRDALAARIILSAPMGKHDIKHLRDDALAHVGRLDVEPRLSMHHH